MIRAVFFDFYTVWGPDKLSYYIAQAELSDPSIAKELSDAVDLYYQGEADAQFLASSFQAKLMDPKITIDQLGILASDATPEIVSLMRDLHGHFLKLGVLANLGTQEYNMLANFNKQNQLLEVIGGPLAFKLKLPLLSRQVFDQALKTIGEPANACLLVSGDKQFLEFANAMGLATLQFAGVPKLKAAFSQMLSTNML